MHLLTLVVAFGALGWLGRPLWFFGDEWEFLVNRGRFHVPHLGLWDPHAHTHWSTTPILIYRALFAVFGLRHYAPYLLLVLLTHIVTAYLLWRVMRRVGVLGLHGIAELLTQRHVRLSKEVASRGQILAATDLLTSGATIVQQPVDDTWSPDLLASDLQQLRAAGDLPAGFTVTDDDRLRAAADLQVVFRPTPELPRTEGARLVEAKAATAAAVAPGCVTVAPLGSDPGVVLDWGTPGSLQVTSPTGGLVSAVLLLAGVPASQDRPGTAPPGVPISLDVSHLGPMLVTLPAGSPVRLCGLSG